MGQIEKRRMLKSGRKLTPEEIDMRAVIDTNVLIYDTFEDSIYHSEAKDLLNSLSEWIIPTIVIHELVF